MLQAHGSARPSRVEALLRLPIVSNTDTQTRLRFWALLAHCQK